jgi:AcrR family transcriptional regulator
MILIRAGGMPSVQVNAAEGRRERKKREVRERISDAARQLFLERGFVATTVEQIARSADVAQATFFNYFPSKSAVLGEMTGEVFERIEELVNEQLARPASAQDRIRRFADAVATEIEQTRGLARDVVLELMRISAPRDGGFPYVARVRDPFAAMLREGQLQGDVRADLDPTFLADMVIGTLNVSITNWLNDPGFPLERWLRQAAAFMGEAIQPKAADKQAAEGSIVASAAAAGPRAGR